MKLRTTHAAVAVLLLGTLACTDQPRPTEPPLPNLDQSFPLGGHAREANIVTRAIALALGDRAIRELVRDDMRASLWTEHKLVLQDYVQTPQGRRLIEVAASRAALDVAVLDAAILSLPRLDFYVPSRAQRLAWRGTPNIVVSSNLSPTTPVFDGFTANGSTVRYDPQALSARHAHFLLEPAERKGRRIDPQPATRPGATIQDADDGEISMAFILWRSPTDSVVIDFADYESEEEAPFAAMDESCDPETAIIPCDDEGTGEPGQAPSDTTRIDGFYVTFCDTENDCRGGNEVEWRSRYFLADGSLTLTAVYRMEGVSSQLYDFDAVYYPRAPLIFARMREGTSEHIVVELVETDVWFDDHYGFQTIRQGDNGVWLTWPDDGQACTGCGFAGRANFGWTRKY